MKAGRGRVPGARQPGMLRRASTGSRLLMRAPSPAVSSGMFLPCRLPALLLGATMTLVTGTAWSAEPPPPAPPSTPLPEGQTWVWVTFPASGRRARLEAYEGREKHGNEDDDEIAWRRLCDEPCAMFVPSRVRLRINGAFRASEPFMLPPWQAARLDFAPARSGLRALGLVLIPTGATVGVFATGGYFLAGAFSESRGTPEENAAEDKSTADGKRSAVILAVAGFASLGVGLALFLMNRETTVDLRHPDAPLAGTALGTRGPHLGVQLSRSVWISPAGLHF